MSVKNTPANKTALSYIPKPIAWCLVSTAVLLSAGGGAVASTTIPEPVVAARAAIVCDAGTGQVIWSRRPDTARPMASTTKIMTAVLTIENGDLDAILTMPKGIDKIQESSLHLIPGETMTVRDLLYGLMMRSANDAAVVLGRYVGGTDAGFAKMMTARARELGMTNTSFKNPNGLHAPGHYSNPRDLAILARHAIGIPEFAEIVATREKWLDRPLSQDKLLKSKSPFLNTFPGAEGIKSGYTRQAGYCYVGASTVNGWRLVTVVLGSDNASKDTANLMNWVHKRYERRTVARMGEVLMTADVRGGLPHKVPLAAADDLVVVVPKGAPSETPVTSVRELRAPLRKGDTAGSVVAGLRGTTLSRVALVVGEDVEESPITASGFLLTIAGIPGCYGLVRMAKRPAVTRAIRRMRSSGEALGVPRQARQ